MKRNIALGFYQEESTAHAVLEELKKHKFAHFATIRHYHNHRVVIQRNLPFFVGKEVIDQFKDLVVVGEILIIVCIDCNDSREALSVLRQVKSGHPVTFLLRQTMFEGNYIEIPAEPMTMEMLGTEAKKLAMSFSEGYIETISGHSLLRRLKRTSNMLQFLRRDIADAEFIEQTIPSSAEWLLDNMYVLEGSIEDVKLNLPNKYYKELPKIKQGPYEGLPRIYVIASELIRDTVARLDKENIIHFLESYQQVQTLTIGELWAFPLMLRLRLIEWVEFLAIHVDNRMREGELASFWGNRLLNASRHEPERIPLILEVQKRKEKSFSGHFAEELLEHLFDEESLLPMIKNWLGEHFEEPLDDVLHKEHLNETSEQVVFATCIRSLIALSQLVWTDIFETVSKVDAILREDPADTYSKMDFATRNSYRTVIERVARSSKQEETFVAQKVVSLAQEGSEPYEKHVGYYLIDSGRKFLDGDKGIARWIINHPKLIYLGGIALITALLEWTAYSFTQSLWFTALFLIPLSELSVQFVNLMMTFILPTPLRPKMDFATGIPEDDKSLVVVPVVLLTQGSIREEINRLEIRYLANTDPALRFALFSDYSDASQQHAEQDSELLKTALEGIEALESKYGEGKFFLFHRQRVWSDCEQAWIGFERKRGKLETLNAFLRGETIPENILYRGNRDALNGIRYVITLDADTQLPKDQAKSLIEVLAHPLNRPYLDKDAKKLKRGYTIIQPQVNTDFIHSKDSRFCKIFSEPMALDPYSQAISNVYQDLCQEGSYHGKGIYDVEAFHSILSHHFPEEHLLSHDLLEGAYVRAGFASHITLFDLFPVDYLTWTKRQHRWIRGDWQISDWIFPKVPGPKNQLEKNSLSWVNRWKIFDNLRRSLLPVSQLLLLIVGWLFSPIPGLITAVMLTVALLPSFILGIVKFLTHLFGTGKHILTEMGTLVLRSVINIALLPYAAYLSLDAIARVAFRRLCSHQNLLQWSVGKETKKAHTRFVLKLGFVSLFAILLFGLVSVMNPQALIFALPFCLLWISAPGIVYFIDQPLKKRVDEKLTELDRLFLRDVGRRTWRYFDELVQASTHFLPPDNYQTALNIEVAKRTSPTNVGMWLIALMNAYDFKYISCDHLIDRAQSTFEALKKLERHEGHFLNWYDIETLNPLFPRYVSTVDSGNLLACFWTLKQGLEELINSPIIPNNPFEGLHDTARAFHIDVSLPSTSFIVYIANALKAPQEKQMEKELLQWDSVISRYFSWVDLLNSLSQKDLESIDPKALQWKESILAWRPSLQMLANKVLTEDLNLLLQAAGKDEQTPAIKGWAKIMEEALSKAGWLAGEKLGLVREILNDIHLFTEQLNLKFLYNSDRKLFSIGYNVDARKLDTSYYDLLASEARISSLVAIAKEDVPLEHWWALGRYYSIVNGRKVLLSWGGTMFEYLMPQIFTKQYSDSLIGEACHNAVEVQIAYGKKRGIPWGISESAYSALDFHKIYQYKSFGVPGLGLKRALEDDLVISPYSSGLALIVKPMSALKNLKQMAEKMMGPYGYYESVDFTRQASPTGERGVIVYTYMAHHQGMIFATINNVLNHEIIINRFHRDPRICGVNSLLYERIPFAAPKKVVGIRKELPLRRLQPFSQTPIMGVVQTPGSVTPKINLLSNSKYSVMITNSGGGYSRFGDIDISRWRSDTTQDSWGSFIYIKDLKSKEIWSTTYHPTRVVGKEYAVHFKGDKAEFKRRDFQIETVTEIVVSPEDNAEIRLVTLTNYSNEIRRLELTSYVELALAPHPTDRAHPCFNKLFIETEALAEFSALLGFRRLRSSKDKPLFAIHVVSPNSSTEFQFETDRAFFIGRGNSLEKPAALERELSHTAGTVLDPIFSLRRTVTLEPGRRVQLSFVTAVAESRDQALALMEKYKDMPASHRAEELAWNYAQLEYRHLRIHQEEAQLFQKLAGRLLYPHVQLRTAEERIQKNRLGQSGLWAQGISGDFPIVVVTVGDIYDVDLVKQLLIAHAFFALHGLKVDLVILNEEEEAYFQPLQEHLQSQVLAYSNRADVPGGVFLRMTEKIPVDQLNLLLACASTVLVASRGPLRQQLVSPKQRISYPPKLTIQHRQKDVPSNPLPFMELEHFNGIGGYSKDGRSYVIYLGPNTTTPAPWINVMANSQFGTLVSEAGSGCTWFGNSQTNRLTPWSNDPLLNPISDAIYIRDEEMGTFWTPTPEPIRELDPYRITHSQGFTRFEHNSHGLDQELVVFVPVDAEGGLPLKVEKLRLKNTSGRKRRLTLTKYAEWILGSNKEETQMHVITEWDLESSALFAYNYYNPDFGGSIAFLYSNLPIAAYTGDRTEFIGRNSSSKTPEALLRKSLSGHTGPALDPCGALQVIIEIDPDQEIEVYFFMGYAQDAGSARKLIEKNRAIQQIDKLFANTVHWWDQTLETIQVDIPEKPAQICINRWLLYQDLSCRFWGRSGFYQSSGAYGYRDQLQDSMALIYSNSHLTKEHILRAAARQYLEGDVQHWWHAQNGAGVRTRCSDDYLWLPFVTAYYVRVTGDTSILDEQIPFIEGDLLLSDQEEVFQIPKVSSETGSLLEHCRRAIKRGITSGVHGLPLIGTGDWNDGMNLVGVHGKGESVWLAWFLVHVLHDFADLLTISTGNKESGAGFRTEAARITESIEATSWDGAWYRRAYFDDGTPIGSKINKEAFIDSIAQSWAVISGHANPERIKIALQSADQYLIKEKENLILLLTPPFDKIDHDPGYIKGYPPGVRENGGQYTHAAPWLSMAFARLGNGNKAVDILKMLNPMSHTYSQEACNLYKDEPYVLAGDVYDLKNQVGRGGWSWYTGAAGWAYRVWLEEVLGFQLRGETLTIRPSIPKEWEQYRIIYRYKSTPYEIIVSNPSHLSEGKAKEFQLVDDGEIHKIEITMEE